MPAWYSVVWILYNLNNQPFPYWWTFSFPDFALVNSYVVILVHTFFFFNLLMLLFLEDRFLISGIAESNVCTLNPNRCCQIGNKSLKSPVLCELEGAFLHINFTSIQRFLHNQVNWFLLTYRFVLWLKIPPPLKTFIRNRLFFLPRIKLVLHFGAFFKY